MSTKRKSDASIAAAAAKKARTAHADAKALVASILSQPDNALLLVTNNSALVALAEYARGLEPKEKSQDDIDDAADKIVKAARSSIKGQMKWKPTCKNGSAKWTYDGLCSDPDVFASVMNMQGALTWKAKKIPLEQFHNVMGEVLRTSVRYDYLVLTGTDVNVRWNPASGEFKFSGTYGKDC